MRNGIFFAPIAYQTCQILGRLQELQARMQEKEKDPTDSKLIYEFLSQDDSVKEEMSLVMDAGICFDMSFQLSEE